MKNWKTTIIGLIGAVATVCLPMISGGTAAINWGNLGTAAAVAALGYFAKDKNVTGV